MFIFTALSLHQLIKIKFRKINILKTFDETIIYTSNLINLGIYKIIKAGFSFKVVQVFGEVLEDGMLLLIRQIGICNEAMNKFKIFLGMDMLGFLPLSNVFSFFFFLLKPICRLSCRLPLLVSIS